jgi:hypothetical protein
MAREGQAPPPDQEDKPVVSPGGDAIGERLTGVSDPKDPDGLITLDSEAGDNDPDFTASAGA